MRVIMIVNWIYVLLHQCSMSNYNSVIVNIPTS